MIGEQLPGQLLAAIQQVLSNPTDFTALHEPLFEGNEWSYVKDCLETGWVSSVGQYVDQFERNLAEYTGSPHAIAVMNGTAALHICLLLAGVKPNDEVLMPSLTFIATANAVAYCGAIPHLIDVSNDTLGVDPDKLEQYLNDIVQFGTDGYAYNRQTGRRLMAVIPMHTFGHPVELDKLMRVCEKYHLEMIEDAAESLGSFYRGRHTGTFGKLGAISFNGNKVITTGGGGAILAADEATARMAKHLTTTAKLPHRWSYQHDQTAYNYRMPNLNAALGCAQLEQLPSFLNRKRRLSMRYKEAFSHINGIQWFEEQEHVTSNYWLNALLLDEPDEGLLNRMLEITNDAGIMTRPIWTPMHRLSMFSQSPRMELTVTEQLEFRIINIPSGSRLFDE
ncbi:LegC family aminotransferase [Paenibacillus radicis (ex Gao et al. 2016)]|uniref:Perosamine synthetase n=1 Tax=Paenibacillus radicis (ex Gao et al. 2016) TaxID=1737354 RepID=A0A917MA18_9BACL|nr:LegC family aminotransferase [Paenibacillus radicis (ex Gao et al. 2016)]GGG84516.1 perosamine synthetase [Paenibacillus radicis (ex Gao et al. 2016)]